MSPWIQEVWTVLKNNKNPNNQQKKKSTHLSYLQITEQLYQCDLNYDSVGVCGGGAFLAFVWLSLKPFILSFQCLTQSCTYQVNDNGYVLVHHLIRKPDAWYCWNGRVHNRWNFSTSVVCKKQIGVSLFRDFLLVFLIKLTFTKLSLL